MGKVEKGSWIHPKKETWYSYTTLL